MTTALQIINGAAEELFVKTAETALQPEDYQMFLDRMNDLGAEWADIGLTPAFVPVSNSTDTVNINRNAVGAMKFALAIRSASVFQRVVSQSLGESARNSFNRLSASVNNITDVAYPDTLPTGSGNDCGSIFTEDRFFPSNSNENF